MTNKTVTVPNMLWEQEQEFGWLTIDLEGEPVSELCASLILLEKGFVDNLTIIATSHRENLNITITHGHSTKERRRVIIGSNNFSVILTDNELGYWLSWMLKYYRDGIAEVDHIDIEIPRLRDEDMEFYLVVKVTKYKPPISEYELRKRLKK